MQLVLAQQAPTERGHGALATARRQLRVVASLPDRSSRTGEGVQLAPQRKPAAAAAMAAAAVPAVVAARAAVAAPSRAAAVAAVAMALSAVLHSGPVAAMEPNAAALPQLEEAAAAGEAVTPVYFGNGCFWGRQFDFVQAEKALGRNASTITAVAGYAGGASPAPKVCYYRSPPGTVYEELGHAEVVQVQLVGDDDAAQRAQFRRFADTYFAQFRSTPFGQMRLDPQDAGPGYRNVVGLPGGAQSPLYPLLEAANVHGMRLVPVPRLGPSAAAAAAAGAGGAEGAGGTEGTEGDVFNTVWVVDSERRGFHRAERYHQFHNGIGEAFPASYTRDLRLAMAQRGAIDPTGCPE